MIKIKIPKKPPKPPKTPKIPKTSKKKKVTKKTSGPKKKKKLTKKKKSGPGPKKKRRLKKGKLTDVIGPAGTYAGFGGATIGGLAGVDYWNDPMNWRIKRQKRGGRVR